MNNKGEEKDFWSNTTIMTTPVPAASSTTQKLRTKKLSFLSHQSDEVPSKDSQSKHCNRESSLGILSSFFENDGESTAKYWLTTAANNDTRLAKDRLNEERKLSQVSLNNCDRISRLPSRYLKYSLSSTANSSLGVATQSTINDSDLLKSRNSYSSVLRPSDHNTSTPKHSYSQLERFSDILQEVKAKVKNTSVPVDEIWKDFEKTVQSDLRDLNAVSGSDSASFVPVEEPEKLLREDELHFRQEHDIPGQSSIDFSKLSNSNKMSMGEFFLKKSENLNDLDMSSPDKPNHNPVPLDDTVSFISDIEKSGRDWNDRKSSCSLNDETSLAKQSITIQEIARLLIDNDPDCTEDISHILGDLYNRKMWSKNTKDTIPQPAYANKELQTTTSVENENLYKQYPSYLESTSNKENFNVSYKSDKTLASARSSSSLSNLVDGKLPIQANRSEVIWGCVKTGKSEMQEIIIKNKSHSKIRIQCSVGGASYKIRSDRPDSEYFNMTRLVLHGGETKVLGIIFSPSQTGAAIDYLKFSPSDPHLIQTKMQRVALFGYGGFGNVKIDDVTMDSTEKLWLCIGQMDYLSTVRKTICITNNGTIASFAIISYEPKYMSSFLKVDVTPGRIILSPRESKTLTVTYTPDAEDLKFIQRNGNLSSNIPNKNSPSVYTIGSLKVISGTEATRGRLCNVLKKAMEKNLEVEAAQKEFLGEFPNPQIPSDVSLFKEPLCSLRPLLQDFKQQEVILTFEQDPDKTLVSMFPDETISYKTLTCGLDANDMCPRECFKLEPNVVNLIPPSKIVDLVLVYSTHDEPVSFEAKLDSRCVQVRPTRGIIQPKSYVALSVKYCLNSSASIDINKLKKSRLLQVLIDDHIFEVEIKVVVLNNN